MLMDKSRPRRALPLFCAVLLATAVSGCEKGGPKLVPVEGTVTVGDQLLKCGTDQRRGYVILAPDAARGNSSHHEPRATIDAEGHYKILTVTQEGAAPGWYKVRVDASYLPNPNTNAYEFAPLVPKRYIDFATSRLAFEVVEKPDPGAYDLKLSAK
jgi:hypothetical protein